MLVGRGGRRLSLENVKLCAALSVSLEARARDEAHVLERARSLCEGALPTRQSLEAQRRGDERTQIV